MVAGAAAWLWTVRPDLNADQVAQILRLSARDVATPGYDTATGYGDPRPGRRARLRPPRCQRHPRAERRRCDRVDRDHPRPRPPERTSGRVDRFEDPRDVLRVWLPAKKRLVVNAASTPGVNLVLDEGGIATPDRVASSIHKGVTHDAHRT